MLKQVLNRQTLWLAAVILAAGCVPEETIRWTDDGTMGVFYVEEKVGLVNEAGHTTIIYDGESTPWPDISADGTMICYVKSNEFADFAAARTLLPADELAAIEASGQKAAAALAAGIPYEEAMGSVDGDDAFEEWVRKYVYDGWKDKLQLPAQANSDAVELCELVLCSVAAPDQKNVLVRSIHPLGFNKFSPDGTKIGYVVCGEELSLNTICIVSPADQQISRVDDNAGVFFDWRDDGRTICYARSEGGEANSEEGVLGTLCERTVADENGRLLSQTQDDGTVVCSADRQELAGLLYGGWFIKVEYGLGGRIFFSSAKLTIPTSKMDDPEWSLFCYDGLTGTVAEILPPEGDAFSGNDVTLFSLSPDGTKIVMPNGKDRVAMYDLTQKEFTMIVGKEASRDDDWPDFVPAWKGDDAICCAFEKEQTGGETKTGLGIFNLAGELVSEITVQP